MRCPNCRCYVPESMERCDYCGYRFEKGNSKTIHVSGSYADDYCGYQFNYRNYGNSQELAVGGYYGNGRMPGVFRDDTSESEILLFQTIITVLLGLCVVSLLFIIALLVALI